MSDASGALVLVVDDEAPILRVVSAALEARGYRVVTAANAAAAIHVSATESPAVIILDLGLPDMDGIDVCRRIRQWSDTPIIVLTAEGADDRKVSALDEGADDYVTKPFSPAELVARVRAVLRRVDGAAAPDVVQAGRATVDVGRREVRVDPQGVVDVTTKEFDLLRFFAERPGLALSRQQILDGVWGYDWFGDARTVDVHIAQVRKKLGDAVSIRTVRGVGYRLESEAPASP